MPNRLAPKKRSWLAAWSLALLLTLVLGAASSFAGSADFKDDAGLLSSSDKSSLTSIANSSPLTFQILTTKNFSSSSQFDSYVNSQTKLAGNSVLIAVSDGGYHGTRVLYSSSLQVNNSSSIVSAGDSFFKSSNWRGGISAIMSAANSNIRVPGSVSSSNPVPVTTTPVKESGGFPGWIIVVVIILIILVVASVMFGRRRTGGGGYATNNYNPAPPIQNYNPNPGYGGGPGYGPGYNNNNGGMGALGGGVIGAAGGGFIGYELGKEAGENEQRNRDGIYGGGGPGYVNNPGNAGNSGWVSGGDSNWGSNDNSNNSGWSSGGDSSWGGGSNDSGGGGGSTFDSGGGGDWGGGGGGDNSGGSSW